MDQTNPGTQGAKPDSQTLLKHARQEMNRAETQNAVNPNTKGSTNEVQPVAADEGLTQ